jgi:hypothetical protein
MRIAASATAWMATDALCPSIRILGLVRSSIQIRKTASLFHATRLRTPNDATQNSAPPAASQRKLATGKLKMEKGRTTRNVEGGLIMG